MQLNDAGLIKDHKRLLRKVISFCRRQLVRHVYRNIKTVDLISWVLIFRTARVRTADDFLETVRLTVDKVGQDQQPWIEHVYVLKGQTGKAARALRVSIAQPATHDDKHQDESRGSGRQKWSQPEGRGIILSFCEKKESRRERKSLPGIILLSALWRFSCILFGDV